MGYDQNDMMIMTGVPSMTMEMGGAQWMVTVLEAEEALLHCLRATQGVGPPPDIKATFLHLDRGSSGSVNRKQFAHALKQHRCFDALNPLQKRVLCDFFDASTDGTAIDYQAFLVFAGEWLSRQKCW